MLKIRFIIILTFFLSIFGCVVIPTQLTSTQVSQINKVLVISVGAGELTRKHVGFTVFTNSAKVEDITDWGLNQIFAEKIAMLIKESIPVEAVTPHVSKEVFQVAYDLNYSSLRKNISPVLINFGKDNDADIIAILHQDTTSDHIGFTNQFLKGLGIYTRFSTKAAYANMVLYLIDVKTGKKVAERFLYSNMEYGHLVRSSFSEKNLKGVYLNLVDEMVIKQAIDVVFGKIKVPEMKSVF